MTIWNALAAGGALWCLALVARNLNARTSDRIEWAMFVALEIMTCLLFGLCLWGAIP